MFLDEDMNTMPSDATMPAGDEATTEETPAEGENQEAGSSEEAAM